MQSSSHGSQHGSPAKVSLRTQEFSSSPGGARRTKIKVTRREGKRGGGDGGKE